MGLVVWFCVSDCGVMVCGDGGGTVVVVLVP